MSATPTAVTKCTAHSSASPCVHDSRTHTPSAHAAAPQQASTLPAVPGRHAKAAAASYTRAHTQQTCKDACTLPDYTLLAQPRTNNYYAAVGHGCPCVPRAPAHPGSWRLRAAQTRSAAHHYSAVHDTPAAVSVACSNCHAYGWRPGPHRVPTTRTAAVGKCDTFGNLAFRSRQPQVYLRAVTAVGAAEADVHAAMTGSLGSTGSADEAATSVTREQLLALEARILAEHATRVRVEEDVAQLQAVSAAPCTACEASCSHDGSTSRGTALSRVVCGGATASDARVAVTAQHVRALLRDVGDIAARPLWQTNPSMLQCVIARHTPQHARNGARV